MNRVPALGQLNMCAKFEVSISDLSRDIDNRQKKRIQAVLSKNVFSFSKLSLEWKPGFDFFSFSFDLLFMFRS